MGLTAIFVTRVAKGNMRGSAHRQPQPTDSRTASPRDIRYRRSRGAEGLLLRRVWISAFALARLSRLIIGDRSVSVAIGTAGIWCVLRLGGRHIVLMRPNPAQFGHLGLEIMYGQRLAARLRAPLWLIRPDQPVNSALYRLAAEGIAIRVFDGWAGRLLTRMFFPEHILMLHVLGLQAHKGAILYGTPFYFLVSLRVMVWVRSLDISTWMADVGLRNREIGRRLAKRARTVGKRARTVGKRARTVGKRARKRLSAVRFDTVASAPLPRSRKAIYRTRKSLRRSLKDAAYRLKVVAAGRDRFTATCLRVLRAVCLRLSDMVEPAPLQPSGVAAPQKVTTDEVTPRAPDNIAALPDAGIAPTPAGPASAPPPEERTIAVAPAEEMAGPRSLDQTHVEGEDVPAVHESIDLYRVANGVSPSRAVAAHMQSTKVTSTYYKRMWLAHTPRSRIPADLVPSLMEQAEKHLGIPPEARLVGLHMRESGFKAGRELHDVKPEHPRNDAVRNVTTANYRPAFDFLERQGFTIVRIGDPTMTPLRHPAVVDLAVSPARTDLLEAYLIERSACFIGCESGPTVVACLFHKPHLVLNATDPLAVIPIRQGGIFTFQTIREIATGRMLTPLDMLFPDYLHNVRNTRVFDYFENGQEDVLTAVEDLIEIVERGSGPETPEQREFRLWALSVGVRLRLRMGGINKWGPHRGYLGGGRMAPSFARKYVRPLLATDDTPSRGALAAAS
jgi:putative glycosyltransferase (TIGR04372 family)